MKDGKESDVLSAFVFGEADIVVGVSSQILSAVLR